MQKDLENCITYRTYVLFLKVKCDESSLGLNVLLRELINFKCAVMDNNQRYHQVTCYILYLFYIKGQISTRSVFFFFLNNNNSMRDDAKKKMKIKR